jgi:hydrophobe/amphiphile efflux-1 (HAE1) family protein
MAKFFINRPIFAIVLAILIMLVGAISVTTLPIEQFPPVAPPTVQINATYPGASAVTMQNTVVQVIEQQMSGIDNLLYMSSLADDTGRSTTTLTFATGTDANIAQVQVQNKLQLATPQLPTTVQQSGIRVTKSAASFLMIVGFVSQDGSMSKYDIANYVVSNVQGPISRINGVGDMNVYGTQYAMRIWLDLAKMNSFNLAPLDVTDALTAQNVQIAGGQLGSAPATPDQQLNATITESTLLRTPEDFGAILLTVRPDGSQVRLRDVARVALGPESYIVDNKYSGSPASGLGIQLAPGANALQTADDIRAKIVQLTPNFPPGLKVTYPNDVTPFIKISMEEVAKTLLEGIALVFLVMYLFLQSFRATLIPSITVPVVLLGTFGTMQMMGFTINTLSMFGLVLAIGLLVDDAIVVVENVERVMHEDGLSPLEATKKAMSQISGALIGVALVLCAVFVPVAFSSGTVGGIYREFSLTIVVSMLLSVFVALSLTPALCVLLLKPPSEEHEHKTGFFGWFNRGFNRGRDKYLGGVRGIAAHSGRWLLVYLAVIGAVVFLFMRLPTSFLPSEDQGYIFVQVQTPAGTPLAKTGAVLDRVDAYLRDNEKGVVDATFMVNGNNDAGRGQSQGQLFLHLKDWSDRKDASQSAAALSERILKQFGRDKDAIITTILPPPIRGLGSAAGFDFELQDQAGLGHEALTAAREQLLAMAAKDPALAHVRFRGQSENPTYKVSVNREKAAALGLSANDIDQAFSIAWGAKYVNNFLDTDNRIKKVYVQADATFRMNPEDMNKLYVRNKAGTMVAFGSFATSGWTYGPPQLHRYNGVEAMQIQGQAAPGMSTGQAMDAMQVLAAKLPKGISYEWTGSSLQQKQSSSQAPLLYALSILVVFLSLAALYESWSIPISVIMVIPIGVLGALLATTLTGLTNDVYFQVGLLTTIGLSAKNAILIVEFARDLQKEGRSALDAAIESAQMRLRPILMTSMAFLLGVLPLAIASGAGSASQNSIGTGVIGGTLAATFLATFMIPMFFVVVMAKLAKKDPQNPDDAPDQAANKPAPAPVADPA